MRRKHAAMRTFLKSGLTNFGPDRGRRFLVRVIPWQAAHFHVA
jgi:hypothetical protein